MLRECPASNAWAAFFKMSDLSRALWNLQSWVNFNIFCYLKLFSVFIVNGSTIKLRKILSKSQSNFWYYIREIDTQRKNGFLIKINVYFTKPLDFKFSNNEKQEVLTWRNKLLRQVKSYIDNNLNPTKVIVIGPTKDSFTQPPSKTKLIDNLEISKDDYCRTLSISKDDDLDLRLKREFHESSC